MRITVANSQIWKGGYVMAYRTHVLYDFSIVSKAKFYVFEEATSIFGKGINYKRADGEFKDPLPVQINPDEFDVTYGSTVKSIGPIENSILNDRRIYLAEFLL